MRIDLLTLCDAAVEVNGRLNVLGTIDYFWAASLPYCHPKCALAARLRWESHEASKKHKLGVQVMDADGYLIADEFTRKLAAPGAVNDDIPLIRHLIVDLESLCFESYGPYAVRIELDGQGVGTLPFSIVPSPQVHQQQL